MWYEDDDFDTTKWKEDFENEDWFIEYVIDVAKYLYSIFTGKDLDDN